MKTLLYIARLSASLRFGRAILFVLVFVSNSFNVNAQFDKQTPYLTIINDKIDFTSSELFNVTIKISNPTRQDVVSKLKVVADSPLQLITRETTLLNQKGSDSLFVNVKFFAPKTLIAGADYHIKLQLLSANGSILDEGKSTLSVPAVKRVTMSSLVSSMILNKAGEFITIPLRIANEGNVAQKINIVARFPTRLQNQGFHDNVQLTLAAFKDTTIQITKKVSRDLFEMDAFSVSITGIYANGDLFGQSNVEIQTLKNTRYNTTIGLPDDSYHGNYNNSLTFNTQNFGNSTASYQLMGGGTIDLPNSRIGVNVDATLYQQDVNNPSLRNTYLTFESHNAGLAIGNITRNFDLNINGRGISGFLADTAHKINYDIGYVDNASNLIGFNTYVYERGRSAWAKFERSGKNVTLRNSIVSNLDPFTRADNMLSENEIIWVPNNNLRISAKLNPGTTKNIDDPVNLYKGVLGSLNFDLKLGKIILTSNNLMSTAYYPGQTKGSNSFVERVSYTSKKLSFWTSFNHLKYEPKFFSNLYNYTNSFQSSRGEIGISSTFKKVSVSLSPIYVAERGAYSISANNIEAIETRSFRVYTQFNYLGASSGQSIFTSIEGGVLKSSFSDKQTTQLKINGNYRYGIFNIATNIQYGSFFIGEALNLKLQNRKNYRSINVTPTLQRGFLRNQLRAEAGLTYNQSSSSGRGFSFTGRGEYQMNRNTNVFASLARTEYIFNQFRYDLNNFQFGITQKLPSARIGKKNNNLEVVFYKDLNQNGTLDATDEKFANQLVYVDRTAFTTNKNGKIVYKNLPDGNYTISVKNSAEWYAADQQVMVNKNNDYLEIGLNKTSAIKGRIQYAIQEYSYEVPVDKQGLIVLAKDEHGKVIKTKTDEGGRFAFYLPTGNYTIAVDLAELPEQITCDDNNQDFAITQDKIENIAFTLSVRSRKIESKKFISTKEREKETIKDRDRDKDKDKDRDKDKQKR